MPKKQPEQEKNQAQEQDSYTAKRQEEKEKGHEANKKTAKVAAKAAADYFTAGQGGAVVDKLAQTKAGDAILNKGADILDKVPGLSKATKKLDESGGLDVADKALSMTSASSAAGGTANAATSGAGSVGAVKGASPSGTSSGASGMPGLPKMPGQNNKPSFGGSDSNSSSSDNSSSSSSGGNSFDGLSSILGKGFGFSPLKQYMLIGGVVFFGFLIGAMVILAAAGGTDEDGSGDPDEDYKGVLSHESKMHQMSGSSGDRSKLVDIALSQLEDSNPDKYSGDKYQNYMGIGEQAWCASFVSWCANEAGIDTSIILHSAAVDSFYNFFTSAGLFHSASSDYKPLPGDLIIWKRGQNERGISHIGIVEKYDEATGQVTTIEGNSSNKVSHNVYTNPGCTGYASPNYVTMDDATTLEAITSGTEVKIPQNFNQVYTITQYDKFYGRWSNGTTQKKMSEVWGSKGKKFTKGIATIDGRYLVAVVNTFGNPGNYIDVYLKDGTVLPCIIADAKSLGDSNITKYGHRTGNAISVIEFEVETSYYNKYGNPGTNGWLMEWKQNAVKIVIGDKKY